MFKFTIFDVETTADQIYEADYRLIDAAPMEHTRDAARRITAAACLTVEFDASGTLSIGRLETWSWASTGGEADARAVEETAGFFLLRVAVDELSGGTLPVLAFDRGTYHSAKFDAQGGFETFIGCFRRRGETHFNRGFEIGIVQLVFFEVVGVRHVLERE